MDTVRIPVGATFYHDTGENVLHYEDVPVSEVVKVLTELKKLELEYRDEANITKDE